MIFFIMAKLVRESRYIQNVSRVTILGDVWNDITRSSGWTFLHTNLT